MRIAIVDGDLRVTQTTEAERFWEGVVQRLGDRMILRSMSDAILVLNPTESAIRSARGFGPDAKIIAIFLEEPAEGVGWAYEAGADLTTVHRADPDEAEKMLRELLDIPA